MVVRKKKASRQKPRRKKKTVKKKQKHRSLRTFMLDKLRAECRICALPDEVRDQIRRALHTHRGKRHIVIEWLRADFDPKITDEDLQRHGREKHNAG